MKRLEERRGFMVDIESLEDMMKALNVRAE